MTRALPSATSRSGPERALAGRRIHNKTGREALANALRHAQAKSIEVELEYASQALRVLVRDSGVGFDAEGAHVDISIAPKEARKPPTPEQ